MKRFTQISNQTRPLPALLQAHYCESFVCRLRGLTFRHYLENQEGLLLVQARESRADAGIHMWFVFMDLAVIWIDAQGKVVDKKLARAWRSIFIPQKPARYVLEIVPERLDEFQVGDQLQFENIA